MLSDGHISQRSPKSNARFVFAQSGKPEKREYFNLVLSLMLPFCTIGYVPYSKFWKDSRHNVEYSSISLTTMQLPCFIELRSIWYLDKVKIVPSNIKDLLTPIALAHWIMGDGSKHNEGLHLSVYSFSKSNVDLLVNALTNKFNISCSLHNTDKGSRIYINKSSTNILRPLIVEHFVPSMKYKLGI